MGFRNPSTPYAFSGPFASGVLLWVVFSLFALFLRGVRWDENYEFAQAMTGAIVYPEGHPIVVYTRGAYNLQFYFSALMALLTDSPAFLNGFRNFLFILASVLPPYLLGAILSRRALVGHLCVIFVLAGIHLEFDGSYPQMLWPGMFSNGHVGTGYALATVALFAGGYLRTASLMLGLMPLVHLGQAPPLFLLAGVWGIIHLARNNLAPIRIGLPYLAAGLASCALFYLIQRGLAIPPAATGPYAGTADPEAVRRGIVQYYDMHRSIPTGNSHIVPIALALVWTAGFRLIAPGPARTAWNWTGLYIACVLTIIYAIIGVHMLLGPDTPYLVIGWLPYRLANHLPPILIALCATFLLREKSGEDDPTPNATWLIALFLFFLLIRPYFGYILPASLYQSYFTATDSIFFALIGAVCGLSIRTRDSTALPYAIALIPALAVVAWMHQFGAACVLAGFTAGLGGSLFSTRLETLRPGFVIASATLAALFTLSALHTQYQNRNHLPIGGFEAQVTAHLAEQNEPGALLVCPPYQLMLQAQTGHPVISDMATHYHASYMPQVAPAVNQIYQRIYEIDLTKSEASQRAWGHTWAQRSPTQWKTLAQEFNFRHVIAPNEVELQLPKIIRGQNDSLYEIND